MRPHMLVAVSSAMLLVATACEHPTTAGSAGSAQLNFMDLCQLSPFAQGTGNLTSTDNDRHVTGSGANAFGFRAEGIVDLVSGGSARVLAESERLIAPDGTVTEILVNNVRLIPQ